MIPAYNSERTISGCLQSLYDDDFPPEKYQIVVVDDGSTDSTYSVAINFKEESGGRMKIVKQSHKGPAAARNAGIRNSDGRIILFMGADCFARRGLLRIHMSEHESHKQQDVAILGHTTWHPAFRITPFMRFLEDDGMQSDYVTIKHGDQVDWSHFYTGNISLKKDFMLEYGLFDETFRHTTWEDIELGYRLTKAGLKIIYDENAKVYHAHPTDPLRYRRRQQMWGRSIVYFKRKHPSALSLPVRSMEIGKIVPEWAAMFVTLTVHLLDRLNIPLPALFYWAPMTYYYMLGVRDAFK